ncbi:glycosyltransferase family 4 protein [Haloplanus pelagicus]|uniref:glycosyltransferase family 4 protein n=1 Tax=Haloplanus pelagicus TaxID=2949995 RepID=UPI00203DFA00|nr:glycosyltransferase family 4 protein [Haloplanus sp. HW8-1]
MASYSILLCSDYLPPSDGGVEHVVENLALRLSERGHDVGVFTLADDSGIDLRDDPAVTVFEADSLELTDLLGLQSSVAPAAIPEFRRVLRAFDPDLVHVHNRFFFTSIVGKLHHLLSGYPLVTTLHLGHIDEIDGLGGVLATGFERTVSRWIVSGSDHVICVSGAVEEVATELGAPRTTVARNSVDTSRFQPTETDDGVTVLYVGRLIRNNGPQDLLAAAPDVLETHPDVRIELFGGGPLEETLRRRVAELDHSDRVTVHGYVDDITDAYAVGDVFCRPSYSEGLPLTLLESMACGIPPVVTPVAGVPEVVTGDRTGRFVSPGDPASIGSALDDLVADREQRVAIGRRAREYVRTHHSWDQRTTKVITVYESVMNRD